MDNKKPHIDALFKDKLQDYEAIPNAALWKEISKNIPQKKKKNNRLLFLAFPMGIAASLALFFMLTTLSKNESIPKTSIVFSDSPCPVIPSENSITNVKNIEKTNVNQGVATITNQKEVDDTPKVKNEFIKKDTKKSKSYHALVNSNNKPPLPQKTLKSNAPTTKQIVIQNNTSSPQQVTQVPIKKNLNISGKKPNLEKEFKKNQEKAQENLLDELLADTKEKKETLPTKNDHKNWSIQPQIAPLAYNSLSGGSTINSDFSNNPQTTNTALSYGIRIAYQLSNKLQIRSGISTASINLTTNDINSSNLASTNSAILFNNSDAVSALIGEEAFKNLDEFTGRSTPPTIGPNSIPENSEEIINPSIFAPLNDTPSIQDTNVINRGSLQQQINYIEIPIELAYRLLNKQFGISLIGGVSSFILTQKNDQLLFETSDRSTEIGEAKNLNNTSFSGNFGIGLDYKIAPNLKISVEPIFKLQFNAFDSNTAFDPYLFGIYSGIKFDL
ncbi:hypothetical protein [Aquimarina agarilytica]|uniref:hypothetical protein n=1 Tax=Aquimarina agarilytica TaxID=1087449 RepID=UPI00028921BA|nr:hypothetical protein [Aquimarina agarilytica]